MKKIYYCIEKSCNNIVSRKKVRCQSCANKGSNNPSFKGGYCSKKHYCKELNCNNEISLSNFLKGNGRCQSCAYKISAVNTTYQKLLTKKFLIKEYIQNGKSILTIAKEMGCSYTVIRKYIIKHNIQIRDRHELNRGKDNNLYKDGRTLIQHFCKNCSRKICYTAWKDGGGRCNLCSQNGKDHWNWKNGSSFEPYPLGWTKTFKEQIRARDEYKCQICGCPEAECLKKLDVHHIDYIKENLNPENLISLCHKCHMETNHNRDIYIEYFAILKEAIK